MARSETSRRPWTGGLGAIAILTLVAAAPTDVPGSSDSPVADAAMRGERETVARLLKEGVDVNAAQGDGMTALHWAALTGDVQMADMLLYAGANLKATTRLSGYTPLFLASKGGHATLVEVLLKAGADVNAQTTTGATPLMLASASGSAQAVASLLNHGAAVNARESSSGQTPLMFAASYNRVAVIEKLTAAGADASAATELVDVPAMEKEARAQFRRRVERQRAEREEEETSEGAKAEKSSGEGEEGESREAPQPADAARGNVFSRLFGWLPFVGGRTKTPTEEESGRQGRRTSYGELVGIQGGMTPLLLAARQGHLEAVEALLAAGADVNQVSEGSRTSPLLIAAMNGHFDLAKYLLERGADPNLANEPAGVTPLYAAINVQYAPHTSYPQPRAHLQQKATHVELMEALLKKGGDPNLRLKKKIWFSAYNFDQSGLDETGATPFWRAAYASDVAAMRLLVKYGADPGISTKKPPERPRVADQRGREIQDVSGLPPVPVGGPAIAPIHAATGAGYGEGFAANEHRNHPAGFLPALRYLVEVLGADVNARDHEGNTPLHNAAARGDVEMIQYLVSKGADVTAVNREGQTTADMANGPVQRIQPFPEALELLVSLGAVNNHNCVSC